MFFTQGPEKGLRERNSPICTLSQNGYGIGDFALDTNVQGRSYAWGSYRAKLCGASILQHRSERGQQPACAMHNTPSQDRTGDLQRVRLTS